MPSSNREQTSSIYSPDESSLIYRGGWQVKNIASDSDDNEPDGFPTDDATTLLARDYKGLSNYASNVVIEIYEIK